MKFWNTLFDQGERTCFANTIYGTAVCEIETGTSMPCQFFSINPLLSSRKDENVFRYRNILLEFDGALPAEQLELLKQVPYSTLVWSGGKSYHAIISLEMPCKDRKEYDAMVRRIYAAVPSVDKANKNPSRFSRAPEMMRDNGQLQVLKEVRRRIGRTELDAWLGPAPEVPEPNSEQRVSLHLSPWTKHFLMFGTQEGGRNAALFKAACDMLRHGYTEQQIFDKVTLVLDLPEFEIISCIRSAKKTV
jgi:hypothetical protein